MAAPADHIIGHTTTSIARLAASRELLGVEGDSLDGQSHEDMRFSLAGVSLLNLQGPIPELSEESPDWLQTYQRAAARMGVAPDDGVRRRGPQIAAPLSNSGGHRRQRPSPYSKHVKASSWDDKKRALQRLEPAFPAVAFDQVYGEGAGDEHSDDYAQALMSLTEQGYKANSAEHGAKQTSKGAGQSGKVNQLSSKFPVKGADTKKPGGGGGGGGGGNGKKYVSSGAGYVSFRM